MGGELQPLGGDVEQNDSLMRLRGLREPDAFFGAFAIFGHELHSSLHCRRERGRVNLLGYLAPPQSFGFIFGTSARIARLSRQPRALVSLTQIPCSAQHWRNVSRLRMQNWSILNR